MKKLVLSMVVAAFAVAVQAGADKASPADAGCCAKKASTEAKAECPMAKQGGTCCKAAKSTAKQTSGKQAVKSPKALADARK
jgi:hypothetical protein